VSRLVDLSPAVPEGFKGPPSTDVGVQFDVRVKPGYWQSAQASLSCHTGCHVESALHVIEGGEPIDAVSLERVIGSAVVLDLTPVEAGELIDVAALEEALRASGETIAPGDIVLLRTAGWVPEDFVVHRTLLGAGIVLVEGLVNLRELPSRCEFFAPFYKFAGIDAAPARAFARVGA
jgi:arylformamidase